MNDNMKRNNLNYAYIYRILKKYKIKGLKLFKFVIHFAS